MNMALDDALLQSVAAEKSLPVLRFYRWKPPAVTLGYAQSIYSDIDLDVCKEAGLDVIRRSTGGRAVLHDTEVTYSVIAPFNSGPFAQSVLDCYRVISNVLLVVLQKLEIPAQLVPGKPRGGQLNNAKAICFTAPSQYELIVNGCKVAGSAQKRHEQCFLQHGSLPLSMDLALLGAVLKTSINHDSAGSLDSVGWLNQWTDSEIDHDELEAMIAKEFSKQLNVELFNSQPTDAELKLAGTLADEKFGQKAWNYKR